MVYDDLKAQDFYVHLNIKVVKNIESLLQLLKKKHTVEACKIAGYLIVGVVAYFIINPTNSNFNFTFELTLISLSGILIIILDSIEKYMDDTINKEKKSLEKHVIIDLCNCKEECSCKSSLDNYLKRKGIKIFT